MIPKMWPPTVVDYDAWEKGYMPPTEHVLIDQLSYRGARVVMSSDFGDLAYWLVIRGEKVTGRRLMLVRQAIEDAIDSLPVLPSPDDEFTRAYSTI